MIQKPVYNSQRASISDFISAQIEVNDLVPTLQKFTQLYDMLVSQLLILDWDSLGAGDSPTFDRCSEVLIYLSSLSEAYLFR